MANNLKKIALFSALAGVAAAGTYYLLQKNNKASNNEAEEIDDFDDFDENLDDDDEFSEKAKRPYVSIDLNSAKEIVSENVQKAIDKTKELITEFNVPEKIDKAKEFVEEFAASKEEKKEETEEGQTTEESRYTTVFEDESAKVEIKEGVDKDIENDFDGEYTEEFEFTEDKNE